jgi:dTDP-4-amino-4,6-dideoxygalactose transaminase
MTPGNSSSISVPLAYPRGEVQAQRAEIADALMRVIDSPTYILGPEVIAFETALAATIGTANAIGVASGTDALVLAQLALGIGLGDEVITPSHTAGPTVAAIRMVGAVPVLVDIDPMTYCIDAAAVKSALSPQTKAIIAVHLYGHPADVTAIHTAAPGVPVIEDCAQAQGALSHGNPVGRLGDIACFSFFPTKNLGAIGDGGAITTNDQTLAERVRQLRTYGWTKPQYAELENGRCSRLDEIQAALLSVKLKALPNYIHRRRAIAARYGESLKALPLTLPVETAGNSHAYHLYVLRSGKRDALEAHLQKEGIGVGRHYPLPTHKQPGLTAHARIPAPLSVTEAIADEILSVPMFSTMTDDQADRVIAALRGFFA